MANNDLGRRWVAALGDHAWAAGVLTDYGERVLSVEPTGVIVWSDLVSGQSCGESYNKHRREGWTIEVPDFSDAPTIGACVGILRRLWGDPVAHLGYVRFGPDDSPCWVLRILPGGGEFSHDRLRDFAGMSEAECLVKAAERWKASQPADPK